MHSERTIRRQAPLRFLRWSRRTSATFHSIGREVTIGHLAGNIVERLALKGNMNGVLWVRSRRGVTSVMSEGTVTDDDEALWGDPSLAVSVVTVATSSDDACIDIAFDL